MSSVLKNLKRNTKRVFKPVQKLLGITDTTISKISKSKYTPKVVSNALQKVQSYGHTVIEGRNNYQPSARNVIKRYGDKQIKAMVIIRQPIQSFINTAFNALTFGQFQKKLDELPYDKLFHLRMVVTMEDDKKIQIEKNEVINITMSISTVKGQEEIPVEMHGQLTLNQLLEGGQKVLGENYFSYRAFGNNCQDYQLALLKGSDLLTPQLSNFIKQDVSELATINPYLRKIANAFTDLGGKFNEIIHGTGIHGKHSKTHKVQSVLFSKKHWTIPKAKKWLKENNYVFSDIDKKPNTLRFRQLDPDQFDKDEWAYTTHRLPDNVELVIAYKKGSKKQTNNKNNMKGKGNELVHIDVNSHNSSGKSKYTMTGGLLDLDVPPNTPRPPRMTMQTPTALKPQGHKIRSKNSFLNNLTTDDIRDLKRLFAEVGEEEIKKKETTAKVRKATVKRVKSDVKRVKTTKNPKASIRGTVEGKRQAIKKLKKISLD